MNPFATWRPSWQRLRPVAGLAAALLGLGGCAAYAPRPLPTTTDSARTLRQLRVDARRIPLPRLQQQRIDPDRPLGIDAVAALAVLNNPQLRLARDRLGIAQAQAFAAGLLPDPHLSASRSLPGHATGATSTAYSLDLAFDLGSLLLRPDAQAAARAHARSLNLDLLWQEWQTAAQAQLLFVRLSGLRQRDLLLRSEQTLLRRRLRRTRAAVAAGNLPRTDADAQLVLLQALQQKQRADAQHRLAWQAQLHALLGLAPAVPLHLGPLPPIPAHSTRDVEQALAQVARIRPDLLALRAGYRSQEHKLREAVLAQFPSIGVDFTRARDTSNINTVGFGLSFNLPLLNGSRGAMAVGRATRRELFDAYQLRLDQTQSQVAQALADLRLLRAQRAALRAALPQLRGAARAAQLALARGAITLPQAQAQQLALLQQRLALQAIAQQRAEQVVGLDLLTGSGLYRSAAPADSHQRKQES